MAGNHGGFGQAEQVHGIGDVLRRERWAERRAACVFGQKLLAVSIGGYVFIVPFEETHEKISGLY